MKKENLFYLILVLTILIIRISILNLPEIDVVFLGFIIHTWWWFHRNIPRFGEIDSRDFKTCGFFIFGHAPHQRALRGGHPRGDLWNRKIALAGGALHVPPESGD